MFETWKSWRFKKSDQKLNVPRRTTTTRKTLQPIAWPWLVKSLWKVTLHCLALCLFSGMVLEWVWYLCSSWSCCSCWDLLLQMFLPTTHLEYPRVGWSLLDEVLLVLYQLDYFLQCILAALATAARKYLTPCLYPPRINIPSQAN